MSRAARRPVGPRIERLEDRLNPGTGTYQTDGGVTEFDFAVSVLFDATEQQLTDIRSAFTLASQFLMDATDGQHRFGEVTIVNDGTPMPDADVLIWPTDPAPTGEGGSYASADSKGFGVRGRHVHVYFDALFDGFLPEDPSMVGMTITHEFGHFLYGLHDHYHGRNPELNASNLGTVSLSVDVFDPFDIADPPDRNFSVMYQFFFRGGRATNNAGPTGPLTVREFSVTANHDFGVNSYQNQINMEADWATVARAGYPITPPAFGQLPATQQYPHPVLFADSRGHATVVAVLDRSGSMDVVRFDYAKAGVRLATRFLNPTDSFGLVSFSSDATADHELAAATGPALSAAYDDLEGLVPIGGTNITAGLAKAIDAVRAQSADDRTPNEAVILLTDGEDTTDPDAPLGLIGDLRAAGISVYAIGIGADLSIRARETLAGLASATGGYFYPVESNFELLAAYFRASMAIAGNTVVGLTPRSGVGNNAAGEVKVSLPAIVNFGAETAVFGFSRELADDSRAVNFKAVDPTGRVYAVGSPGVESVTDGQMTTLTIPNPRAGKWTLFAETPAGNDPNLVQLMAATDRPGASVTATITPPPASPPPPPGVLPPPTVVKALGQGLRGVVLGATVKAIVTRPDGTRVSIQLYDDGSEIRRDASGNVDTKNGKTSGDTFAFDGVYTALFDQYSSEGNGSYSFDISLESKKGSAFVGGATALGPGGEGPPAAAPDAVVMSSDAVVVTGVPRLPGGTVTGRVFDDANANRRSDAGEPGLEGVLVFPDYNLNGLRDSTEPFGTTDRDGAYQLDIPDHGAYVLLAELPDGKTLNSTSPVADVRGGLTTSGIDFSIGDPDIPPPTSPPPVTIPPPTSPPPSVSDPSRRFVVAGPGNRVSVRDGSGAEVGGFNAFDTPNPGGPRPAVADFNRDGVPDVVVGTGAGVASRVRVLDGNTGAVLADLAPFEASFTGGVFVAAGDVDGDGVADLVVTADAGGGLRVRLFLAGTAAAADFFWLDEPAYRGGSRVAVADVDADGRGDIVLGAGPGGGPRVAAFGGASVAAGAPARLIADFFALEPAARTGVFVAAGDLSADGRADVAVGAGAGGGPRVTAFDAAGLLAGTPNRLADFFADAADRRAGVSVVVRPLTAGSAGDLVTGTAGGRVVGYPGSKLTVPAAGFEFDGLPEEGGPVFVG